MSAAPLLLLFAAVASSSALDIAQLGLDVKIQNDPQCQFEGHQCSANLREVIYCTSKNGDSYVTATCAENRKCKLNPSTGQYACARDDLGFPDQARETVFTCQGTGLFPDGHACGTAYMCGSTGEFPDLICKCPEKHSLTTYPTPGCSPDEDNYEACGCPFKDRCKESWNPGDFGPSCPLPGYYYLCQPGPNGTETIVKKCPEGQSFLEGMCRSPSSAAEEVPPSSAAAAGVVPFKCEKYFPPCLLDPSVKCSKRNELLPHKVKRCYYYCGPNLKPEVRDCGKNGYFSNEYGQWGCRYKPSA